MRRRLWEKVGYQHKISAPSAWFAITHRSSKSRVRLESRTLPFALKAQVEQDHNTSRTKAVFVVPSRSNQPS
jgi:hypothetical protein